MGLVAPACLARASSGWRVACGAAAARRQADRGLGRHRELRKLHALPLLVLARRTGFWLRNTSPRATAAGGIARIAAVSRRSARPHLPRKQCPSGRQPALHALRCELSALYAARAIDLRRAEQLQLSATPAAALQAAVAACHPPIIIFGRLAGRFREPRGSLRRLEQRG